MAKREDFAHVIRLVEATIETQQLDEALVGMFNANIISRKLGLADRHDHTTDGKALPAPLPATAVILTKEELKDYSKLLEDNY